MLHSAQNAFLSIFNFARRCVGCSNMASSADSKTPNESLKPQKRKMVLLKTKEECRLGNEMIQVWTVELPSKHAEGILK